MKPDHFKKINPNATCLNCWYCHKIVDQHRNICARHDFTLPDLIETHVCSNFKDRSLPVRTPITDVLGDNPYSHICDEPRTLILKNVWVTTSRLGGYLHESKKAPELSGAIKGYDRGVEFSIDFNATEAFLEE